VKNRRWLTLAALAAWTLAAGAQSHDSFTPMPLDSGFGRLDLTEPATPADEIIKNFAAKETEFQDALNHYTYRREARVQTIDDDTNKVDGEWYQVDDVTFDPTGRRMEKTVFAPESSLERVMMSPSDLQDIQKGYPFVLTTAEIAQYNVKYVGKQQVDEVKCYVFDVAPADRRTLLVPGLHEGRRHAAYFRRKRLHVAGCAYARHDQVHRLQAIWFDDQADLRRTGHYAERTTAAAGTAGEAEGAGEAAEVAGIREQGSENRDHGSGVREQGSENRVQGLIGLGL
jgi:hypothetical protein